MNIFIVPETIALWVIASVVNSATAYSVARVGRCFKTFTAGSTQRKLARRLCPHEPTVDLCPWLDGHLEPPPGSVDLAGSARANSAELARLAYVRPGRFGVGRRLATAIRRDNNFHDLLPDHAFTAVSVEIVEFEY